MKRKSDKSPEMSADLRNDLSHLWTAERANQRALLDMRCDEQHLDHVFTDSSGKKGLRDVCGNVLIEPLFDDFPELYTSSERISFIPVVLNGRYHLYDMEERKLLTKAYDRVFRYFWAYIDYFVAEENGKKGILSDMDGTESTPVIMDEIYQMQDPDGAIPFVKDGKVGFLLGSTYAPPIFDRALIRSEQYTQVQLNGVWGWIDSKGEFTLNKMEAAFGSWYDWEK